MTSQSCYFDLGYTTVRVIAPEIESLQAFFEPYVTTVPRANDFYELTTVVDAKIYEATRASLPATPDTEIPTMLQHDLEYKLQWFHTKAGTLIADEPLRVFYAVHEGQTRLIATEGSRVRTALLRIIRGAWVLGQSGLIVHGCGVEKNGRGIVISGDKFAGKTTSLLSLCLRKGYNIVANDRLLLSQAGVARGIPTVVKLRPRTLKPFPEVGAPSVFAVSDLARELKVSVQKEASLKTIAFLSYDQSLREPQFRKLSHDEAREALASHLFSRREYEWVKELKLGETVIDSSEEDVLNGVSCYKLTSNETHIDEVTRLLDHWCQQ
jgi:hypothetical protein